MIHTFFWIFDFLLQNRKNYLTLDSKKEKREVFSTNGTKKTAAYPLKKIPDTSTPTSKGKETTSVISLPLDPFFTAALENILCVNVS